MNKLLVIGPTYQSQTIKIKDYLEVKKNYQSVIKTHYSGGCCSIVQSLLTLDIETFYITRLAYDTVGNSIMNDINSKGGFVYSNGPAIKETPTKIYINDVERNQTIFSSVVYDNYPSLKDGLPYEFFNRQNFGIVDAVNTNYLDAIIHRNQQIRWLAYDFIPDDRYLSRFEGIFLTKEKADSIINTSLFASLTNKLFAAGLKWLIVYDGPTLCEVFTPFEIKSFTKEKAGNFPIGCFETFIAMTAACYINNYSLYDCIQRGLSISNELSYIDEVKLMKEMF